MPHDRPTRTGARNPADAQAGVVTLIPVDTGSALAVSDYLDRARGWLATAVEMTGPHEIAAAKAEIATAAEATKQLGLSKGIQLDAQEMVRRAEYALGKAIRKGQAEGTIARVVGPGVGAPGVKGFVTSRSRDEHLAKPHEVANEPKASLSAIYQMSDGIGSEQMNAVLDDAKAEGNLSRANVVRKIKGAVLPIKASVTGVGVARSPAIRRARADLIADLAAQGYSSRQMPAKIGVSEETVRRIARDFDIEIPADRSQTGTRRINSTRMVENTATALEGLVMGVELIDYKAVDPAVASQWIDSLTDSLKKLRRFVDQTKETTQ